MRTTTINQFKLPTDTPDITPALDDRVLVSDTSNGWLAWDVLLSDLPVPTSVQDLLDEKASISWQVFTGAISATNLSGTNTWDQTITLTGAVTWSGTWSFATTIATPWSLTVSSTNSTATAHTHAITSSSAPWASASILATDATWHIWSTGTRIVKWWFTDITATNAIAWSITGNSATVTTNANLTGHITSTGNATTLWSFTMAQLDTAVSDGNVVYQSQALGTPASWNLDSCTANGTDKVWFRNIPQNSQSVAYTTVLADAGKHLYHPSADTTARTFTIDSNANVAYPIWTALTFVNDTSAWTITIAITTDTLVLAGAWTTGSRTLASNWIATAIKVTSTRWFISWTNLT